MRISGTRSGRKFSHAVSIKTKKALNSLSSIKNAVFPEILASPSQGLFLESLETRCLLSTMDLGLAASSPGDEWVYLENSSPLNASDTEALPEITINNVTIVEGDSGTTEAIFTVSLSKSPSDLVFVHYTTAEDTTADDPATAGVDYQDASSGTKPLEFTSAGVTELTFPVVINSDTNIEPDETFLVNFTVSGPANLVYSTVECTIVNDDLPVLSINDVTVTEGDNQALFTVSLSEEAISPISVKWRTVDVTTTADQDYQAGGGSLSFWAGSQNEYDITIDIYDDTIPEGDETFYVELYDASSGVDIVDSQGDCTIKDDDVPELIISDLAVTVTEGDIAAAEATFTVTISQNPSETVSVTYATADDTTAGNLATSGDDYQETIGTLEFSPDGPMEYTISVPIINDTDIEADETFLVNLSIDSGMASLADSQVLCTIEDDDLSELSITGVTVTEADSQAAFTVTMTPASPFDVTVKYATADGTTDEKAELLDNDYEYKGGTLTFLAGETEATISVTVNGDTKFELDETFFVNLSNAVNAAIITPQATGTINNNDDAPTIEISSVSRYEDNSNATTFGFEVSLTNESYQSITVGYATVDNTATSNDGDYVAATGTLSFEPGESLTQTLGVSVKGDTKFELDETFFVNLSNAVNTTITTPQATGTIENDDTEPIISISSASMAEGNSGISPFSFIVSLSNASYTTVTVNYETTEGGTATVGDDYMYANGSMTIAPGDPVSRMVELVDVNGDTEFENDEIFYIKLSDPTNANLGNSQAVGTISNDDSRTLTVEDVSILEGNDGTRDMVFTITMSHASDTLIKPASYATADGDATWRDNDYENRSGTLTFLPGSTETKIFIPINGDTKVEGDEIFYLNLSSPINGVTILDGLTIGTIINDDDVVEPEPELEVAPAVIDVDEGFSNTFTVKLTAAPTENIAVNIAALTGSDEDLQADAAVLSFTTTNWDQPQTVTVTAAQDDDTTSDSAAFLVSATGMAGKVVTATEIDDDTSQPQNNNPTIGSLTDSPDPAVLGGELTLVANNVNDSDGTVVTVEFYRDANGNGTLESDDTLLGYGINNGTGDWTWSGSTNGFVVGNCIYLARAKDNLGDWSIAATTAGIVQDPENIAPTIDSLSASPATVTAGDDFTLIAQGADDSDGTVIAAQFYRDVNNNGILETGTDEFLGVDTNGDDGWSWTAFSDGFETPTTINCLARVQDDDGAWSSVVVAPVTVTSQETPQENNKPNFDSLTDSPDLVFLGNELTLVANNVTDSDGTVTAVEFYRDANGNGTFEPDDTLLGYGTANDTGGWTWSGSTSGFVVGQCIYLARALDDDNAWSDIITTTGMVVVESTTNMSPVIGSLVDSPDPIVQGANINLTAAGVADSDGTVIAVEFYRDANGNGTFDSTDDLLGTDTNSDDGWSWSGLTDGYPIGVVRYFARAQDDDGAWSSHVITVGTVQEPDNSAPTIESLNASPETVAPGDNFTLTAQGVTDSDSDVVAAEFYHDVNGNGFLETATDQLLGTDTDGTDGWNWTGSSDSFEPATTINCLVRVQDNDGAWSAEAAAAITVMAPPQNYSVSQGTTELFNHQPAPIDYGSILAGNIGMVMAFNLQNNDDSPLLIESLTVPDGYILMAGLAAELPAGSEDAFVIQLDGSTPGIKDGLLTIAFADGGIFEFSLAGVVWQAADTFGGKDKATFIDSDGDTVTVSLSGSGTGTIYYLGDSPCDAGTIVLSGTTEKSTLTIKTKGRNTETAVDEIIVDGPLKAINAATTDLQNSIIISGSVTSITLDDILADSVINTAAASARGTSFKADTIADNVTIDLSGSLKKFQSNTFADGILTADTIGQVKFDSQTVGADIVSRTGEIKSVQAYGDIAGDIISNTFIGSVTSKGEFTGSIRSHADLGNISFDNIDGALISAYGDIKKVSSKRDIVDTWILAGYDVGADAQLAGTADNTLNQAGGDIGSIKTGRYGNFNGSFAMAGVQPYYNQTTNHWTIAPQGQQITATSGKIGKASLGQVFQGDPTDPYGLFAASKIGNVKVTEVLSASGAGDFQQQATWI